VIRSGIKKRQDQLDACIEVRSTSREPIKIDVLNPGAASWDPQGQPSAERLRRRPVIVPGGLRAQRAPAVVAVRHIWRLPGLLNPIEDPFVENIIG